MVVRYIAGRRLVMIKYDKLFALLEERKLSATNYLRQEGMHPSVVNKLRKNERVNTDTINKLCGILHCQPGDILEYIED